MLPAVSLDYFFGISANQFAIHNAEGQNLLGSVVQAQLTIPLWTWGAAHSRVKQAEFKLQQAKNDLTYTQRNLLAELDAFYREAAMARDQLASLRESVDLSKQSLDLTLLRYQAGEVSVLEVVDAQSTRARCAQCAGRRTDAIPRGRRQPADTHGGVLGNEESMVVRSAGRRRVSPPAAPRKKRPRWKRPRPSRSPA